jgi:hypothetical protein
MPHFPDEIEYSDKYKDDHYEYWHVLLPKDIFKKLPKNKLLSEMEWRQLGWGKKSLVKQRVGSLWDSQAWAIYSTF